MTSGEIRASGESVETILTTSKYEVPFFQRGFAWEREQVIQFWEDVRDIKGPSVRLDQTSPYFIGAMVFESGANGRIQVIDGQQRLATITILLAVVRDLLYQSDEVAKAQKLQNLISKSDWHEKEEYIITLSERDLTFFQDMVQKWPPTRLKDKLSMWQKLPASMRKKYSNKLILDAYHIIHDSITRDMKEAISTSDLDYLLDFADIITKKLRAVTIYVGSDADAFGVFETLNHRGIELSIADLFKNHVFSVSKRMGYDELERVKKSWGSITNTLGERNVPRFLRHYWISRFRHVRQRELYDAIKKDIKERNKDISDLIREVETEAEVYEALVNPTSDSWRNTRVYTALEGLKSLGVKQCYPLLLSAKMSLTDTNFTGFSEFVGKLTFRYSTICRLNPNRLEREYSHAAIELRDDGNSKFAAVLNRLLKLSPDDRKFKQGFLDGDFKPNASVTHYILRKIEMSFDKESPWVVGGAKKVHVEHIMPKKLEAYWSCVVKDHSIDHERVVKRLGNMTLLEGRKNTSISNSPFPKKKKAYDDSKLRITEHVAKYDEWTEDSISKRQQWLYERAKDIWGL